MRKVVALVDIRVYAVLHFPTSALLDALLSMTECGPDICESFFTPLTLELPSLPVAASLVTAPPELTLSTNTSSGNEFAPAATAGQKDPGNTIPPPGNLFDLCLDMLRFMHLCQHLP